MTLSEGETQRLKESGWKRRAKGRPMRWRILRDGVAILSLRWMSTTDFQICMRRLWAIKRSTAREILEELEEGFSIHQERDEKDQLYKWGATRQGVRFWIGKTENIPARIAQVALTIPNVNGLEV